MVASTAFLMTLAGWTELRMDNEKLYSEEDEFSKEVENTNIEKQQKAAARKNRSTKLIAVGDAREYRRGPDVPDFDGDRRPQQQAIRHFGIPEIAQVQHLYLSSSGFNSNCIFHRLQLPLERFAARVMWDVNEHKERVEGFDEFPAARLQT